MASSSLFKTFINSVAKAYGDKPGKMLVHTGVIGWTLSAAAQVVAIVINDKIPKEQKYFMIPQEIADAAVNIASFYLITQGVKSFANKLVNSGKLLSAPVRDFLKKSNVENVGKASFDVIKNGNLTKEILPKFKEFRDGIDVIATTIGSIISCNLVTPVVRNQIAAERQKKSIEKFNKPIDIRTVDIQGPILSCYTSRPTFNSFQNAAYSRYITSKNSMTI